ncbi:protein bfr2-like [Stegodyphus dumicola]|uniref:protein bfr2-like n=1 Tax=Stegodyphus dumicola TaxID=202533 RepID=UPI0015A7DE1C|nr:protein bfr2-like [Stegodyphus dumicola]
MKLIIPIACFAACLALTYGKRCETEDDCDDGQCCVALTSSHMMGKGRCLKLSRAGRRCNEPGAKLDYYGGKYLRYCPCQDGLECAAKRKKVKTISAVPVMICQKPAATTVQPPKTEEPEGRITDVEVEVTTNIDEIVKETEETTVPDETGDETGDQGTGDETGDEGTGDETGGEGTGDETPDEGIDDELEGPGGEPPRDDDCEDWELPC